MVFAEINIAGEELFKILGFPVTNTFLLTLFAGAAIVLFSLISFKGKKIIPGSFQNFWEFILESILNFFDGMTGSREKTKEIFPLSATLFLLILFSNFLELIPGIGVFHFLRSPSSDLNFTLALAIFAASYINITALRKLGLFSYLKKFFNFKNPIFFFVGILEGINELSRIFSLAFRLFGNLFAGEVLLIVTSCLFAYLLPLPFLGLEILIGLIQSLIFSYLIVVFYVNSTHIINE